MIAVLREEIFSPGKVEQDAQILRDVAQRLSIATILRGEDLTAAVRPESALVMCQSDRALKILESWKTSIVNSPAAIRNCYRHTLIPKLQQARVPIPLSTLSTIQRAAWPNDGPVWVKRGDVHAVHPGDVVLARDAAAFDAAVRDMTSRGVEAVCVQRHVEGTTLKFYALADGSFFRIVDALPPGFDAARARDIALQAAQALQLDVFGGDFLAARDGSVYLLDVNDWPTFSRCRAEAAPAIADYVRRRYHDAP